MPDCDRIVAFPDVRNANAEYKGKIRDIRLTDFHVTLVIEGNREVTCDLHGNVVGSGHTKG
jgi:hypothetical protein